MHHTDSTTINKHAHHDIRIFHFGVGLILFLESIIIWLLSSSFTLPVTTSYLQKNLELGVLASQTEEIFRIQTAHLLVLFLLIAGISHLIISLPKVFKIYSKNIEEKNNPFRWLEYGITAPIMVVTLALLTGVFDLSTLILLWFLNVCMILFGQNMEAINKNRAKTDWSSFIYGGLAGAIPWIIIWMYIVGARAGNFIPVNIIWAFASLVFFFTLFPANLFLYYKKIGPWKNYEHVENMFILLSLVSKSALAWQIFIGVLG